MAAKIRLARRGKKGHAYYHIVVADSRAPRDGKYIEILGNYNPGTNPATIELNFDKAVDWLKKGAQPTDTCRAILSYKGVLMRRHLDGGVAKGALTQEQADAKFEKWMNEKQGKIDAKRQKIATNANMSQKERLAYEQKVKEAKADAIRKKAEAKTAAPAAEGDAN